jgi:hypothetical protein
LKETFLTGDTYNTIAQTAFFEGYYADKVMEIHSSQTGTEKDFVVILEQDKAVLKWLRPALNQFHTML